MVKKSIIVGLILLLLAISGCQAQAMSKNIVYSKELNSTDQIENTGQYNATITKAEAVTKAQAAFRHYFAIQNFDSELVLKWALIQNDRVTWNSPYWKLSWVGKDDNKLVYSSEIDAQTGEVILLRCQLQERMRRAPSREELLTCKSNALEFIKEYNLIETKASLNLSDIGGPLHGGPYVDFKYGPGQFIMLHFDQAGKVIGFTFSYKVAFTLSGSDLKINRDQAVKLARENIKRFFGEADTKGLIERVGLFEGKDGHKTWFVYWYNLCQLEDRIIHYGAQIDADSGKIYAVEGQNIKPHNKFLVIKPEKLQKYAEQYLKQKHLSGYRFQAYEEASTAILPLRYKSADNSKTLRLHLNQYDGKVEFISFVE